MPLKKPALFKKLGDIDESNTESGSALVNQSGSGLINESGSGSVNESVANDSETQILRKRRKSDSDSDSDSKSLSKPRKGIFCESCSSGLCNSCKTTLAALKRRSENCSKYYDKSAFQVALRRMPALLLTMTLELIGGYVINQLSWVLKRFMLLSSFMPVIHAISGNLGLQTASNITRGLATGNVDTKKFKSEVKKEGLTGIFCSIAIAVILGSVAATWVEISQKEHDVHFKNEIHLYPLIFGGVVCLGTFLSMIISSTNGSVVPFLAQKLKLDPAKFAGPLETAFQDIAGSAFLLGLSASILNPLAPPQRAVICPPMNTTSLLIG